MWVSNARPLQSPTAYSQPPDTPAARNLSSTSTNRPGVSPTPSSPISAVDGRRPTATRISSALISRWSPSSVATTGPSPASRRAAVIRAPVMTAMPSASNAARTSSPAKGSSRDSSRGRPSTTVTSSQPSRRNACAISAPIVPPPRTSNRRGSCLAEVMSRLSHGLISRSPGIGGMTAPVPVASTTARRAMNRWTAPSPLATSTARSPASRPTPRTRSMPLLSSHGSWLASFQSPVM